MLRGLQSRCYSIALVCQESKKKKISFISIIRAEYCAEMNVAKDNMGLFLN